MKISTKGRYALRLMLDLAANSQHEYTPVKEISLPLGKYCACLKATLPR